MRAQVMEHWHLGIGRKPSLSPPEFRRELRQLLTENQGISASKLQGLSFFLSLNPGFLRREPLSPFAVSLSASARSGRAEDAGGDDLAKSPAEASLAQAESGKRVGDPRVPVEA